MARKAPKIVTRVNRNERKTAPTTQSLSNYADSLTIKDIRKTNSSLENYK